MTVVSWYGSRARCRDVARASREACPQGRVRSNRVGGLTVVVAGPGSGLVAAPVGPAESVVRVVDALGGKGDDQAREALAGLERFRC